jgi:restriction endonuclease S subunit
VSWPIVKLGDIFEVARGGSPRPIDDFITDEPDGVNWISIRDASSSSKYITRTEKKILQSGVSKSRQVKPGDFLLTNSMSFGRPYILKTSGCIHDGWLVLSGDDSVVDQDYFYHLLGSDFIYRKFQSLAAGAVVKNLNTELVKTVELPLPPVTEQRRIAAILDKADALRAKRRDAIATLDQLLDSVFIDLFGDPLTNPKGWPVKRLDSTCALVNGRAFKPEEWEEAGMPIIRIQNLNDTKKSFNYTAKEIPEKFRVRRGDTLFSWSGTPGTSFGCFRWGGPEGWLNQHIFNVRLNGTLHSEFFIVQVNLKIGELIAKAHGGVGLQHVTKGMVDETMLMIPPLDLQDAFTRSTLAIDEQRSRHASSLASMDMLFGAIQRQAFSGSI